MNEGDSRSPYLQSSKTTANLIDMSLSLRVFTFAYVYIWHNQLDSEIFFSLNRAKLVLLPIWAQLTQRSNNILISVLERQ